MPRRTQKPMQGRQLNKLRKDLRGRAGVKYVARLGWQPRKIKLPRQYRRPQR